MAMFTYNCISCGFKLGDGLPPIEALDFSQRIGVGTADGTGLRLDGTSGYQYCTFCLLFEEEYNTLDKEEHPHYQFSDLGRTEWIDFPDSIGEYYDPVFANWNLMIYTQGISASDLPSELFSMWLERHDYVEEMTDSINRDKKEREMEAAKLSNRIKKQVRHVYLRIRERVLPFHLENGLQYLWMTITMDKNMDEKDQDMFYSCMGEDERDWHYTNRISDPFAKFELWALEKLTNRFFDLYA